MRPRGEEDEDVEDLVRAEDKVERSGRETFGAALGVAAGREGEWRASVWLVLR